MRKFHQLTALLPAAIGCTAIFAADDSAVPVIITATRTAQNTDATLASVTVITREDLERNQVLSVQGALRDVPGINIDNNGGLGKYTSIFMRGTNPGHVLILVDGIKVGSATAGTTAIQDIPVDQIERIEVVRGPLSSLYGSEAIGGVIQIFTRKGQGLLTPNFSIGAGSHHTYKLDAGLSRAVDDSWFSANLGKLNSAGINACRGEPYTTFTAPSGGCYTIEPDADGYRQQSAALRAGHRFSNDTDFEASALRSQGDSQYDGTRQNEGKFMQQMISGKLRFAPINIWRTTLLTGRSWDNTKNYLHGDYKSKFNTRRDTVSLQNDVSTADNQLATLGFDYQNDSVNSDKNFTVTERDNKGVFAQYQTVIAAHTLAISARRDNNEQFGYHSTGSLAWGYAYVDGPRLSVSVGSAFKAPTFNDLYWPIETYMDPDYGTVSIYHGIPTLSPEKSQSVEIGIHELKMGDAVAGLSIYQTRIRNLIDLTTTATGLNEYTTTPENLNIARIRGVDAELSAHIFEWNLNARATLLKPEDRSAGPTQGKILRRRAQETFRIDADRAYGEYRFGTTLFAAGKSYEDLANTEELAGYATLDLRAEYAIDKSWRLQGRVANLFDKHYETARYYNQDGRNYFLTLRYQPTTK